MAVSYWNNEEEITKKINVKEFAEYSSEFEIITTNIPSDSTDSLIPISPLPNLTVKAIPQ